MCSSDADISGICCVWQESIPSSQPESHGLHLFHLYGKFMKWRWGSFGGIGIRTDPGPRGGVKPVKDHELLYDANETHETQHLFHDWIRMRNGCLKLVKK